MENKQKIIIIAVIAVLIGAGIGFWFWSKSNHSPSVPSAQTQTAPTKAPTLGGQLFDKTQNSLKGQVPETNPFKKQKNPLDTIYKNPFQ